MFTKPVDSAGSFGTQKIFSTAELAKWAGQHHKSTNFEIDEYIEGKLYHSDIIVKDDNINNVFISKYSVPNADFIEGKALGSYTLDRKSNQYKKLNAFTLKVLKSFAPLPSGLFHLEFFEKDTGDLVFLEIAYLNILFNI